MESRLYPMFESIRQALLRILELPAQPAVLGPATYGMYVIENSITEDVRLLENAPRVGGARAVELCEALARRDRAAALHRPRAANAARALPTRGGRSRR